MSKSVILAGLVTAIAIVSAPAAAASPDGTKCGQRGGGASGCQRPGHSSLHTAPDPLPSTPSAGLFRPGWTPGYGVPVMPVID